MQERQDPLQRGLPDTCCGALQSKDKQFNLIPGRWHVLLKEPGNDLILKEVISWMTERVT